MYSTISVAAYRQAKAAAGDANVLPPPPGAARNANTHVLFPPPAGPYSGYLLLQGDDEAENSDPPYPSCCLGRCKGNYLGELPFPQDKCLAIFYPPRDYAFPAPSFHKVYMIPVLGQPISSHCYYVVLAQGKDKGLVETCSTPEDIRPRCFCQCVNDIPPRFLQPTNPHQHLRITSAESGFISQCTASNSYSPAYLRMRTWCVLAKDLRGKQGRLPHVGGENADLRAQLASFEFPVSQRSSPAVIVGEWYCPFIFINEVGTPLKSPKNQLMKCPFYKMDLEKFWEEIYSTQGRIGEKNDVVVDKILNVEEALLFGKEAIEEITYDDGSVLFRGVGNQEGKTTGVKLSWPIIARMREDQGRHGSDQGGKDVRVEKSFSGIGKVGKFACYVVVERYVLKRMDGSIALTYSFRNCNQIQGKWEENPNPA
ncbi:uncharacterized protein LOC131040848 isoform X2 [Cryptomeria japonica]|uniref:uncharacterized protein LOC131040848 isoform X2 n=1 Tax=Cryptomeria japonica TaxID=3369 RepID=UPI0027D9F591|nr:uncharacterized protein LOC131040848 isoform X2 [Cryptomeria japonica]